MSDMGFDYLGYQQRKRAAGSAYGAKAAQNAYAQFLSQQRGARQTFDVNKQFEQQAPRIVSSFSRRGLAGPGVQSGIFARGLQDLASQKTQAMADIAQQQAEEKQQYGLTGAQDLADYQQQLAALEAEKQQQIASAAATLSAFKPFLGG